VAAAVSEGGTERTAEHLPKAARVDWQAAHLLRLAERLPARPVEMAMETDPAVAAAVAVLAERSGTWPFSSRLLPPT